MIGLDARMEVAGTVLDSLRDWPAAAVRSLGTGLALDGGPLAGVGRALLTAADNFDAASRPTAWRHCICPYVLRLAAGAPGCDELLERLGAAEAPWPAVRAALGQLRRDPDGAEAPPWSQLYAALVELRDGGP